MLAQVGIIGHGVAAHCDLHQGEVLSSHPPDEGTQSGLGQALLRTQEDLFKAIVFVRAVPGDEGTGLGEEHVTALAGDL